MKTIFILTMQMICNNQYSNTDMYWQRKKVTREKINKIISSSNEVNKNILYFIVYLFKLLVYVKL